MLSTSSFLPNSNLQLQMVEGLQHALVMGACILLEQEEQPVGEENIFELGFQM